MLRLRDRSSLLRVEDPDLRRLIERRFAELVEGDTVDSDILGEWFLVEPGDGASSLDEQSGVPLLPNPCAEVSFADAIIGGTAADPTKAPHYPNISTKKC